jgi:prophage regulatory protein
MRFDMKTHAGDIVAEGGEHLQRFLRRGEVVRLTGLPVSTIYEQMSAGIFPRPVRISARSNGWIESEIAEWQAARIAERNSRLGGGDGTST